MVLLIHHCQFRVNSRVFGQWEEAGLPSNYYRLKANTVYLLNSMCSKIQLPKEDKLNKKHIYVSSLNTQSCIETYMKFTLFPDFHCRK